MYAELSNALRQAGAEHLVLKGFAQWAGYVRDPLLRMQSDIDIFCPSESVLPACDAISVLGYEPLKGIDDVPSDHLPSMIRKTDWKWRGDFFDPEAPFSVDIHFVFGMKRAFVSARKDWISFGHDASKVNRVVPAFPALIQWIVLATRRYMHFDICCAAAGCLHSTSMNWPGSCTQLRTILHSGADGASGTMILFAVSRQFVLLWRRTGSIAACRKICRTR
jgi:hypothetical protein